MAPARDAGAAREAEPARTPDEALILAAQRDDPAGARRALEGGAATDTQGPGEATPLMFACHTGSEEIVRLLLGRGADINRCNQVGDTPLSIACWAGHGRVAMELVEAGASVNTANEEGFTPLMGAARDGDQSLVELLLAHGADPTPRGLGGNTAATIAATSSYYEVAGILERAEVLWLLKAQKLCLRNFAHEAGGVQDQERFIFYEGGRFFRAQWIPAEQRLEQLLWWTETEFKALLSHGHYGSVAAPGPSPGFVGEFSEIPEAVLKGAPARAQRCEELIALLSKGTHRLALRLPPWRAPNGRKSDVSCRDSQWFLTIGGAQPCSAERALHEIEETLRHHPDAQPIPVKAALVKRAHAATDRAREALRRFHEGEVWNDQGRLRFAHGSRLYLGFRRGKGPVTSVVEQSEESVFEELVGRYARGGKPKIAPSPDVRKQVAALVEEGAYPALLREGKIAVGGGATTETTWILSCRDGRYFRDSSDSMGERSLQELGEEQALEILSSKRYQWVGPARPVPWGRAESLPTPG